MTAPSWDLGRLRRSAAPLARPGALSGVSLGRYRLLRELASGAMGVVYEAEDESLRRRVAVKVLREVHGTSEVLRRRFQREALAAASLSHPNVLRVYDAGEADGKMFLAMELVEGRSLKDLLDAPPDLRTTIALLVKVARGVAAAHEKGIVHRDVKPANILVTAEGEPKVADFGLAHLADSQTELTRSGTPIGTPAYMAPEQVRGDLEHIGPATDVYALGVILYEMLTQRTPHTGDNPAEIYGRILSTDPVPPRRIRSKIDAELETICLKAIESEPSRRYATARDFADDLQRHLDGESILARPPGAVARGWKWMRRHRTPSAVAAVSAVFLAAIAMLVWTAAERRRAETEALGLLEKARPALDKAAQGLYREGANLAELRQGVAKARPLIDEAILLNPRLAIAQYLLGRAWELEGWEERAEAAWRRAIELEPSFGPAQFQLGRLLAIRSFTKTVGYSAEDRRRQKAAGEALSAEAVTLLEGATRKGSGFDDQLQLEVATILRTYLDRAPERVRDACIAAASTHAGAEGVEEFHWLHGWVTAGPEQMAAYDEAIRLKPNHALARFCRGLARSFAGNYKGAEEDNSRALEVNPRLIGAWINRADARVDLKKYRDAVGDCDEALKLDAASVPAIITRAVAKRLLGDLDGAIADYGAAIGIDPGLVTPWFNRGNALVEKGDLAAALADYDQAVSVDPASAPVRVSRGHARNRTGNVDGAVEDWSKAIEIDPRLPEPWLARGAVRFDRKEWAAAVRDLRKAVELAPSGHPNWALMTDLLRRAEANLEQ